MPWFAPWSEGIKKRVCRYLLQRYLGQFLEEKLTLDQLTVDLYNGTGVITHLSLDCNALNELGETQGWPFEFIDGFVREVNVSIPWSTLLKDDSFVQVNGLTVTIQPKQRPENVTSMFESMWSSMTSSMQLAAECLMQEGDTQCSPQPVEGIELFAQTIDSILCRVKVKFLNTFIRIEHVPIKSNMGVALEVHIKNIDYLDEAGSDPSIDLTSEKSYVLSTFSTKKISLEGVTLYTDEFPSIARTFSRSMESSQNMFKSVENYFLANDGDNSKHQEYKSSETENTSFKKMSNPILFGKLSGKQEIRVKIKQSEEAIGPKVDFQVTFGSFTSIITPRQFHVLLELADGLASPHLEDNSNVPLRSNMCMESKPMQKHDFERVEAQLTGQLAQMSGEHGMSNLLKKNQWSTANIDDSDQEEDKFLPLASRYDKMMTESCTSTASMSSSMTSNASSSASLMLNNYRGVSPHHFRRKKGVPQVEGDPNAETSHINMRITAFAMILLHEDILTLTTTVENEHLSNSSIDKMKAISDKFFKKIGLFAVSGYGSKDVESANKAFDSALSHNHLRIIGAPIIFEGNEKTNSQGLSITGNLTIAKCDIKECLYDTSDASNVKLQSINLLKFEKELRPTDNLEQNNPPLSEIIKIPNVKFSFSSVQKLIKTSGENKYGQAKVDIRATLDQCIIELDISIIDRMNSILNMQPVCKKNDNISELYFKGSAVKSGTKGSSNFYSEFRLTCPLLHIKLRFPVTDLRPTHDMSKPPWWQRNVRDDFLLGVLKDVIILNTSSPKQISTSVKIQSKQFDIYYKKSEDDTEVHIAQAVHENLCETSKIIWPTVTIDVLNVVKNNDNILDSSSDTEMYDTANYHNSYKNKMDSKKAFIGQTSMILMDRLNPSNSLNYNQSSPFSSKKMVHESDTPHGKNNEDDPEELVIPGDSEELKDFFTFSINNSYIKINCEFPIVSLQLTSKHLYEIIYNRINSDLLLWEPSAPKISSGYDNAPVGYDTETFKYSEVFSKCKSAANYNSDSENSTSSENSNVYYSVYDQRSRPNKSKNTYNSMTKSDRGGKMNKICLSLIIGKGQLTLYTPARDSTNHVLPGQQGEVIILTENLSLCYVGGVGGNIKKALVSLQTEDANVYHCGLSPVLTEKMALNIYGSTIPTYLKHIMYLSNKTIPSHHGKSSRQCLSFAISIKPNKEYLGYKMIKVAVGISNVTLYHIMMLSQHTWLNQIIDMFDVLDYPIPGYEPSIVITELHIHFWNCAIDYRPLHLPIHSVITLNSFNISSNVVAKTNASNLRFIAEECALFLCDEIKATKSFDLKKDFVCVMDLGLFELSLRLNEKGISTVPRIDLRASNNVVHVRTCSDSFKLLCKVIKYLANDGDFNDFECFDPTNSDNVSGTLEKDNSPSRENDLIGLNEQVLEEIRDLSKSQVQHVNDMMAEAMIENLDIEDKNTEDREEIIKSGVEVFFFPDESNGKTTENFHSLHAESQSSLETDLYTVAQQDSDSDVTKNSKVDSNKGKTNIFGSSEHNFGESHPISVVTKDLGDYNESNTESHPKVSKKSSGDNTDDEFCILGEDFTAIKRKVIEPVVHWLTDEPISIIDNHFSIPLGKTDLLKPPKNFPTAVLRYTLCEMTLIWHMYGGNDFKSSLTNDMTNSLNSDRTVTMSNKNNENNKQSPVLSHRDPYGLLSKGPSTSSLQSAQTKVYFQNSVSYNKSNESISHLQYKESIPGSPRELPWKHRGGIGRRHDILMELQLNKVQFQHETYPNNTTEASRQILIISSVEIRDRLACSQINKFLYQYTSEMRPKQKHANMVVVKAVHLRPDPKLSAQECCLKISLLPLRFNIDQDSLLFLIGFFSQLGDSETIKESSMNSTNSGSNQSLHSIGGSSRHSTPTHQPPVMSVNTSTASGFSKNLNSNSRRLSNSSKSGQDIDNLMTTSDCGSEDTVSIKEEETGSDVFIDSYEAERLVSENLIQLEEDMKLDSFPKASPIKYDNYFAKGNISNVEAPDDVPVYFRNVVFSPDVPIRLDYHGKRVDLTHGPLAGLLMGLGQLNCSELKLKSLSYRHGLLGIERLIKWALQEWISDIKRRQLPGLLGGVGPMHSLVQLFQGIRDLFWLPIEQYQRDGRIVRGLQRGASSFTTSTAMAALDITTRIIHLIQATAETAYDMVSPSPGLRGSRGRKKRRHERVRQPQDIREGITNAYLVVKEGLGDTAQALADVATSERAARGYTGAVGGVLRQLPPTAIAPVLLASEAAVGFLGGVRATLAPADHKDHQDKWRGPISNNDHLDSNK